MGGRSLPGSHLQALKNLPRAAGTQHRAGWASLPPGAASPGPWTAGKKRKANFCASVAVKVSFLPSFLFFWGCFISTSLPCSSAWATTCPGELVGCCSRSSLFLISSLSPGEGGRDARKEGVPWPNPLQQRPQSRVGIQGSALPALPSVHGFALATLGLKVGF